MVGMMMLEATVFPSSPSVLQQPANVLVGFEDFAAVTMMNGDFWD
jgi:hypothetical protein